MGEQQEHNKSFRLSGLVVLITGTSSGIGREIALAYAAHGAKLVACADIRPDCLQPDENNDTTPTHELIASRHGSERVSFLRCDVRLEHNSKEPGDNTMPMGLGDAVTEVVKLGGKLDVLVNNAGVFDEAPTHNMELQRYENVLSTNSGGTFIGTKFAVKQFLNQEPNKQEIRGTIINVSSIGAFVGFMSCAAYCAAKSAIAGMTRATAIEYGSRGIRCNAICPGYVDTPMIRDFVEGLPQFEAYLLASIPAARLAQPSELAGPAVWLAACEESSYVNGACIPVDGGFLAR